MWIPHCSSAGGRRSAPTKVDLVAAPERSSRLRQIKSSYRRFLGRGASTAISTANGTTGERELGTKCRAFWGLLCCTREGYCKYTWCLYSV